MGYISIATGFLYICSQLFSIKDEVSGIRERTGKIEKDVEHVWKRFDLSHKTIEMKAETILPREIKTQ
jgi:ubiquinone biosynthesis protein COQ9